MGDFHLWQASLRERSTERDSSFAGKGGTTSAAERLFHRTLYADDKMYAFMTFPPMH